MLAGLPFDTENFSYGFLTDEYKQYVNADFVSPVDGYDARIEVRYRGVARDNWNAKQKSLRIKFPKDNLYRGMSGLHLLLPSSTTYFGENLNIYRAKKLGVVTREKELVKVYVNGVDNGVYWAMEPWSGEFLARNGITDTNNIFSNKDKINEDKFLFRKSRIADWHSYTAETDGEFEELKALFTLLEDADDEEFAEKIGHLFNLDKFYRWQLLSALAGSNHVADNQNFILVFRQETGKFEPFQFDIGVGSSPIYTYADIPVLPKRILANKQFLEEYKKVVDDYTSDENNLKNDLAYYDGLYEKYSYEIYKDQAKSHPDYVFDRRVKKYRSLFIDNFYSAGEITVALSHSDFASEPIVYSSGTIAFEGSFNYLNDIFLDIDQFLAKNPQFVKLNRNSVALPTGEHIFKNITIIPRGLYVIIESGAKLLFLSDATLVSYSPVTAIGTPSDRIEMRPLLPDLAPWGGFSVINTGNIKNKFYYISVSGGGAKSVVNGVPYSSQFNIHNSISEIFYSNFENGRSDDAMHIVGGSVTIAGSVIKNTSSDGIDLDFVKDSSIADSIFFNSEPGESNGDGIDLSGTENLTIRDNKIIGFGDKCISVGEMAEVEIKDNILAACGIGIAVKDRSRAELRNNIIAKNEIGLALYRKKDEFISGGTVVSENNIFSSNNKPLMVDDFSYMVFMDRNDNDPLEDEYDTSLSLPDYLYSIISNKL